MSSFVIDKVEYIKCAGLLAGLLAKDRWSGCDEEIRNRFSHYYELNAKSVQEQYNDKECQADGNEYIDQFNQCKSLALEYSRRKDGKDPMLLIKGIQLFMRSVLYQTENDEASGEMARDFTFNLGCLIDHYVHRELELHWWGEVDLDSLTPKPEKGGEL